jgi:hypothetical protein
MLYCILVSVIVFQGGGGGLGYINIYEIPGTWGVGLCSIII